MLKKIISGGQNGVERACLDVAVSMGISCGGWMPAWRNSEDKALAQTYHLQEMAGGTLAKTTAHNVMESDGTLILYWDDLKGLAAMAQRIARQNHVPCLAIDLGATGEFDTAKRVGAWIDANGIEALYVTGPTDPDRYEDLTGKIREILDSAFLMAIFHLNRYDAMEADPTDESKGVPIPTVAQMAEIMLSRMSFKEKTRLANVAWEKLADVTTELRQRIETEFQLSSEPMRQLIADSSLSAEPANDDLAFEIVKKIWENLQESNTVLRVVK